MLPRVTEEPTVEVIYPTQDFCVILSTKTSPRLENPQQPTTANKEGISTTNITMNLWRRVSNYCEKIKAVKMSMGLV